MVSVEVYRTQTFLHHLEAAQRSRVVSGSHTLKVVFSKQPDRCLWLERHTRAAFAASAKHSSEATHAATVFAA